MEHSVVHAQQIIALQWAVSDVYNIQIYMAIAIHNHSIANRSIYSLALGW